MDRDNWNQFIIANSSPSSFLQSWEWGEFQEALGNKVYRLGQAGLQALVVVRKLHLGRTYLETPKGPILQNPKSQIPNPKIWGQFIHTFGEIGKKEKAVLVRANLPYELVSKGWEPLPSLLAPFKGRGIKGEGFRKPEILLRQTEPEDTVLVDLSKSEEELLQNMHEKSRYNIRLAGKKGVKVRVATKDQAAFETFLKLLDETSKRDGITSWPRQHFLKFREKFISTPSPAEERDGVRLDPYAELLVGELNGQTLAAAIVMLFGDAGTYLYAASSAENRPANAPSLVLWEAVKLAKERGKKWYDMWGVAPKDAGEDHSWSGITRFKTRYIKPETTGKEVRNIGTLDFVLDKKFYALFKLAKKFKP